MAKFGHSKTPALETPEGCVSESSAIAKYFARLNADAKLLGSSSWEEAQVDQWLAFVHTTLMPNMFKSVGAILGYTQTDKESFETAVKLTKDHLKVLDNHLNGKQFLVGDNLTVADVIVSNFVLIIFQLLVETNQRKAFAHLSGWFERVSSNPHFIKRNGKPVLCARPIKPVFAEPAKKEEKKKAVVAAPVKKEEKEMNPLDALPPSTFDMYDFKTFFVNEPDVNHALSELFAKFDSEGFSFWYAAYEKYEGEGEKLYLTQNLMNGFLQRADNFRKHGWAVMGIIGEEPALDIVSCWMFRGQDVPQEMIDHPQFEYYTKRKLDVTNAADKELITDFFKNRSFKEDNPGQL
jgi:elongation factor 1-gamma